MKKSFTAAIALLFGVVAFAQTDNVCTSKNTYILRPFDGPLTNPHKGFCVPTGGAWSFVPEWEYSSTGSKNNRAWDVVTHGTGYQRWDKLNPAKGVYDWTELDKLLDACEKNGIGYGLRVFPYSSAMGERSHFTVEEDYDWTPKHVYEAGAKKTYATLPVSDTVYTLAVPVWDDPIYLQAHKDFAAALAEKYDGDPRLEYIDIRCFGNWGEWHVSHFNGTQMPSDEVLKDMLLYYSTLFHKTLLVLPSDGSGEIYEYAISLGIAKRDDGLIGTPDREYTLQAAYEANLPTIGENIAPYEMMLQYTDVIPGGYLKWRLDRWQNVITQGHLTYYVLDQGNDAGYRFYLDNKVHVDSMTKVLGYNFRITDAELLTVSHSVSSTDTLKVTIANTGVAPCFFDLYMVAEYADNLGNAVSQLGQIIMIPKGTFKDGETKAFEFVDTRAIDDRQHSDVVLSLYESEEAYLNGKNPTVRFDNDRILSNKKLHLASCSHLFSEWDTIRIASPNEPGLRRRVCSRDDCHSYEEETTETETASLNGISKRDKPTFTYASGNSIYLKGVLGKPVCLYNAKGELCDKRISTTNNTQFLVHSQGVYFILVDGEKHKVIVK